MPGSPELIPSSTSPEPHDSERESKELTEDEAHLEANMMRVLLGVSPSSGKMDLDPATGERIQKHTPGNYYYYIRGGGEAPPPTKEDYEQASASLTEIMHLVEEEPGAKKMLFKILRGGHMVGHVLAILSHILLDNLTFGESPSLDHIAAEEAWPEGKKKYWDDARKLADLVKKSQEFGESE